MEPDITRNYHGGNAESMAAFASTPATERRKQRARVLAYITSQGQSGATSDEAELALGLPHQACSARFTELKKDALIVPAGQRVTRSGRKARVWVDRNTPGLIVLEMKDPPSDEVPVTFEGQRIGTAHLSVNTTKGGVQTEITWDDAHLYAERHPLDALEEES